MYSSPLGSSLGAQELWSDNLLSQWHRHTEVLNGLSLYSTVLQRQVKAEEERMLAGASAPEHRTIALEANFQSSLENKGAAMCTRTVRDRT